MQLTDSIEGISYNLDNQRVTVPGKNDGRSKVSKRTVYRISIDDNDISGSILLKGEWNRVIFNGRNWRIRNEGDNK